MYCFVTIKNKTVLWKVCFRILTLFTHFILRLYISLTRNIFPIPDDAVDRGKLGSELLILNSSFRPHSTFYIITLN